MELIGVLAVMAILAGMMAPSVFSGINEAYATAERGNLETLADDLERYISSSLSIPSRQPANWSSAIASMSGYREAQILDNARGYQRGIYFDPQFMTTAQVAFNGYTQTSGLSAQPNSPRLMIISDFGGNVPTLPADAAEFNAIWNQSSSARYLESDEVMIQRVHLGRYFHRIVLTNTNSNQPGYALENQAEAAIPSASGAISGVAERYLLEGTRLQLNADPFPVGTLLNTVLVTQAVGYSYIDNGTNWMWVAQ